MFTVLLERFINNKSTVDRIILAQFVMTFVVAGVSLLFSWVVAYSAFLGGLVTVLPGYVAARRLRIGLMRIRQSELSSGVNTLVVRGELVKFALSVILFIAIFVMVASLNAAYFFATFAGTQLLYLVLPVVEANRLRNRFKNSGFQQD